MKDKFSKKKIILIFLILIILLIGLFICFFILDLKRDKNETILQMDVVVDAYNSFSLEVDNFNDIRNQLYLDIFENTYYETLSSNDKAFKEMFTNYEEEVDKVIDCSLKLEKLCKNIYYPDSKINTKCSDFGSVYEQIINAFVSDVTLYNKNIDSYNKYQVDNNGDLFLNSYVTKKKFLDYNGDKKYEGKEEE